MASLLFKQVNGIFPFTTGLLVVQIIDELFVKQLKYSFKT